MAPKNKKTNIIDDIGMISRKMISGKILPANRVRGSHVLYSYCVTCFTTVGQHFFVFRHSLKIFRIYNKTISKNIDNRNK